MWTSRFKGTRLPLTGARHLETCRHTIASGRTYILTVSVNTGRLCNLSQITKPQTRQGRMLTRRVWSSTLRRLRRALPNGGRTHCRSKLKRARTGTAVSLGVCFDGMSSGAVSSQLRQSRQGPRGSGQGKGLDGMHRQRRGIVGIFLIILALGFLFRVCKLSRRCENRPWLIATLFRHRARQLCQWRQCVLGACGGCRLGTVRDRGTL